jgi:hypothetical protein
VSKFQPSAVCADKTALCTNVNISPLVAIKASGGPCLSRGRKYQTAAQSCAAEGHQSAQAAGFLVSVKTKLLFDGNSKQKAHIKFEGLPEGITKMRIKLIARQIVDLPRPIFQIIAPADRDISCQQHDFRAHPLKNAVCESCPRNTSTISSPVLCA